MTAIVDYDTGNLRSVADAMRRIGAEFTITAYPALLRGADRVLLPGVGEASSAMAKLRELVAARKAGASWEALAAKYDRTPEAVRKAYFRAVR